MSFNFYLLIPLRQQKSQKVHSVKQILSAKRSPPIEFSIRPYRVRRDTRPWRGPVGDPPGKAHAVGAQEGHVHDPQAPQPTQEGHRDTQEGYGHRGNLRGSCPATSIRRPFCFSRARRGGIPPSYRRSQNVSLGWPRVRVSSRVDPGLALVGTLACILLRPAWHGICLSLVGDTR